MTFRIWGRNVIAEGLVVDIAWKKLDFSVIDSASVAIIMQFSFSKEGDLYRLRQLYDKDEDIIHQVFGNQRKTLLHLSVENKRIDMVSYILENGKEEDSEIFIS